MQGRESWRNIGPKIRYLRKAHGLTIKELAAGCGLSPNAISLLEKGEVAPTVATLCKVAAALGTPASSFFQEICPDEVILTRAQEHYSGQVIEQALQAIAGCATPQSQPGPTDTQSASLSCSHEFVLCLNGRLEYEANGETYQLGPGDTVSFNGNVLHCWRSLGDKPAVAVMVLSTGPNLLEDEDDEVEGA